MHENRVGEIRTDVYPVPATEVCCRHGTQVPFGLAKREKSSAAPEDFLARYASSNKRVAIPLAWADSHESCQQTTHGFRTIILTLQGSES